MQQRLVHAQLADRAGAGGGQAVHAALEVRLDSRGRDGPCAVVTTYSDALFRSSAIMSSAAPAIPDDVRSAAPARTGNAQAYVNEHIEPRWAQLELQLEQVTAALLPG